LGISEGTARQWEKQWRETPALPSPVEAHLKKSLFDHYSWADNLADYYANLYRSSFVFAYLMSAVAVLAGTLGAGFHAARCETCATLFTAVELAVMILLLLSWRLSHFRHWHDRWIDYRLLAEYLRLQRFLAPLGFVLPATRTSGAHRSHGDPKGTWMYWHFRSVVREAGLTPARLDAQYLGAYHAFVWKRLIMDQWRYHRKEVQTKLHRLHSNLHTLEKLLIRIVIVASAWHLLEQIGLYVLPGRLVTYAGSSQLLGVLSSFPFSIFPFSIVIAAACPAFSAALYAIGIQAELDRLVKRSEAMSAQFEEVAYRLSEPDAARSSQTLFSIIEPVAESMIAEHFDWRLVFQEREWTPV
jgi:uncharacterized Tic20 family protein